MCFADYPVISDVIGNVQSWTMILIVFVPRVKYFELIEMSLMARS
jgi:hypothetical protein